ncbi:MAG: TlpA disulfide reductase family protein [Cyclobacteriaceae bacterium]
MNSRIDIYYNVISEESVFATDEKVWARINSTIDYVNSIDTVSLKFERDQLVGQFKVQPNTQAIRVEFYSIDNYDWDATLSDLVYDGQGQVLPGAFFSMGVKPKLSLYNRLQSGIDKNPNAIVPYGFYFQNLLFTKSFGRTEFTETDTLRKYERLLESIHNRNSAEFAFSDYMLTRLANDSIANIKLVSLIDNYPESTLTAKAIQSFSFQNNHRLTEEIAALIDDKINKGAKMHLSEFIHSYLMQSKTDSDKLNEVIDVEIERNPISTMLLSIKAQFANKGGQIEEAISLQLQILALNKRSAFRHSKAPLPPRAIEAFGSDPGSRASIIASNHSMLAYSFDRADQIEKAIAHVDSAMSFDDHNKWMSLSFKAELLKKNQDWKAAENSYQLAYLESGEASILDSLESLYPKIYPSAGDIKAYLQKIASQIEREAAPKFEVNDLNENEWNLGELKGMVVVLNFWFIGCKPCIIEMPKLNELVAAFTDQEVVFLAFALDNKSQLTNFLEKRQFDYQIIPDGMKIASDYQVKAYPTHFIIDQEGSIVYRQSGAFETIGDILKQEIQSLMK